MKKFLTIFSNLRPCSLYRQLAKHKSTPQSNCHPDPWYTHSSASPTHQFYPPLYHLPKFPILAASTLAKHRWWVWWLWSIGLRYRVLRGWLWVRIQHLLGVGLVSEIRRRERVCDILVYVNLMRNFGESMITSLLLVHLLTNGMIRASYRAKSKTLLLRECSYRSGPHGRELWLRTACWLKTIDLNGLETGRRGKSE